MPIFHFADYRADTDSRELRRGTVLVPLTSKAFETLSVLLRHHGRVVSKDELLSAVWPDTFVSEDSLTHNISVLRRALGEAEFIATIPRKGYRFIGELRPPPDTHAAPGGDSDGAEGGTEPRVENLAVTRAQAPVLPPQAQNLPTAQDLPSMQGLSSPQGPFSTQRTGPLLLVVALAAAVVGYVGWTLGAGDDAATAAPSFRFVQAPPPGTGALSGGMLAPSGDRLAFLAQDSQSGTTMIWVRALDSTVARAVPGTEGAARPFWSPDGEELGFFANGRLRTVSLDGSARRSLAPSGVTVGGASWGADGTILFAPASASLQTVRVADATIDTVPLPARLAGGVLQWPQFLPDGRRFLFFTSSAEAADAGWYVASLDAPQDATRLFDARTEAVTYAASGHLLFLREGVLFAQPVDDASLALAGAPVTVAGNVVAPSRTNSASLSASGTGLVVFEERTGAERLVWYDRNGRELGEVDAPTVVHNPTLSPDGSYLVGMSDDPEQGGVWLLDLDRGTANRFVSDGTMPLPSPDGTQVAYASRRRDGRMDLYVRPRLGDATGEEALLQSDRPKFINDWSRDDLYITYGTTSAETGEDLWLLPRFGDAQPMPYLTSEANEMQGRISPDGRWMAYASDESGRWEVYVQAFPGTGRRQVVSAGRGGAQPQWRQDGRELFYLSADHTLMAVPVTGGDDLGIGRPVPLFRFELSGSIKDYRQHYAASQDGQRFLVDAVEAPGLTNMTVVVNWQSLLAP